MGEREGRGVGMALGGAVKSGSACSWWRRAGKQGRAVGRGRHGSARLTGGGERQRGPVVSGRVQEEERKVR
jgi:hypothetical protein